MALEVYLVRHGKTVFNTTGRVQGWSDSPLTTEGREIAERLGRNLHAIHFDAAFANKKADIYLMGQDAAKAREIVQSALDQAKKATPVDVVAVEALEQKLKFLP